MMYAISYEELYDLFMARLGCAQSMYLRRNLDSKDITPHLPLWWPNKPAYPTSLPDGMSFNPGRNDPYIVVEFEDLPVLELRPGQTMIWSTEFQTCWVQGTLFEEIQRIRFMRLVKKYGCRASDLQIKQSLPDYEFNDLRYMYRIESCDQATIVYYDDDYDDIKQIVINCDCESLNRTYKELEIALKLRYSELQTSYL